MKKSIITAIQILVLLVASYKSYTQDNQILKSNTGEYFYNEKQYQIEELEFLICKNPQAYYSYKSGLDKGKSAHRFLLVGGTTLGLGVVSFITGKSAANSKSDSLYEGVANYSGGLVFGTIGAIGILTGTLISAVGLSKKVNSSKRIKKGIDIYNQRILLDIELKETSSLDLKGTSNGVGIVLNF